MEFEGLLMLITHLASTPAVIVFMTMLVLFMKEKRKILLSFAILFLVVYSMKALIGRQRPPNPYISGNDSFPSGHSAFSMLIALWLWKAVKRPWRWLAFIYPAAIGLTRILLRVHYPSDVLGGFVVAWVVFSLVWKVKQNR